MIIPNWAKLVLSIGVAQLAGIIGSVFTVSSVSTWYAVLEKPSLNPPAGVFGPVWTTLFVLMGIALFLVWKQYPKIRTNSRILKVWKIAIVMFFVQLVLNTGWSILFFGLKNPGLALIEIIILWLAIVVTMVWFYKISKPAAYLLAPYIAWVSFAVYLNYAIWTLN